MNLIKLHLTCLVNAPTSPHYYVFNEIMLINTIEILSNIILEFKNAISIEMKIEKKKKKK